MLSIILFTLPLFSEISRPFGLTEVNQQPTQVEKPQTPPPPIQRPGH